MTNENQNKRAWKAAIIGFAAWRPYRRHLRGTRAQRGHTYPHLEQAFALRAYAPAYTLSLDNHGQARLMQPHLLLGVLAEAEDDQPSVICSLMKIRFDGQVNSDRERLTARRRNIVHRQGGHTPDS
jgi:hypothetical protein